MSTVYDSRRTESRLVLAAQADDGDARQRLIESLRPLIGMVARTYRGCPAIERRELMQEGVVGLLRALRRFDASRGTPFWGYATWYVRQAMQRLVAELGQPVVLSDRALRQLAQLKDARREFAQDHGEEPTARRLASVTGLSRQQIDHLLVIERDPRRLDEPLPGGGDRPVTVGELLTDPSSEEEFEQAEAHVEFEWRHERFGRLSDRQRRVLGAHFGIDGSALTLREIGSRLGISAERVRQIEQEALERLRGDAEPVPGA
jgi:RNA polymerase primary sigma factor